jgi:hypothetical protein
MEPLDVRNIIEVAQIECALNNQPQLLSMFLLICDIANRHVFDLEGPSQTDRFKK